MEQIFSAVGRAYQIGTTELILLLLLFTTFVGILLYVLGGKQHSRRIEDEKYSIFDDEAGPVKRQSHKEDEKDGKES